MNVIASTSTSPKWTRKPKARPEEVLEAALDLFARNGFAATRMEDIAAAAGLSKAAIYLYFPSKDDVFKALVETRIVHLRSDIVTIGSEMKHNPILGLRQVVQVWAASNADHRMVAIPQIVLSESPRFPELADYYHRVVISQTQSVIVELLEAGIHQGLFRQFDANIAARALVSPMMFEMLRRQAFRPEGDVIPLEQLSETFFDLFLHGITAGSFNTNQGQHE